MWTTFFLDAALCTLALYLPGFFLLRGLRFSRIPALTCAPIGSLSLYCLLPVIYDIVGIACWWATLVLPALALSLAIYGITLHRKLHPAVALQPSTVKLFHHDLSFNWSVLCLYILIGIIACGLIFVKGLDGAESFVSKQDNVTHLNAVKAFLDSGSWSTLHVSNYLAASDPNAIPYDNQGGGFYPAGWHILVALVCSLSGSAITVASNAVNAVLMGIVFPGAMFLFMRALFPDRNTTVLAGSIIAVSFTAFPWGIILKGPLYPNMASLVLMVAVIAASILFMRNGALLKAPGSFVAFTALALSCLAIVQTSSLFAAFLFLWCFFINQGCKHIDKDRHLANEQRTRRRALFVFGSVAVFLLLWFVFYSLPFMQGVVQYDWKSDLSLTDGIYYAVSLALSASLPQPVLAAILLFGVFACIASKRTWLLAPATFMLIAYVESRTGSGFLKHYLGGMWYTDPYRLAALFTIFATPIASMGADYIAAAVKRGTLALSRPSDSSNAPYVAVALVTAAFIVINFCPNHSVPHSNDETVRTAFGSIESRIESQYSTSKEQVYSQDEIDFVNEATRLIPEGSLVLNQPNDGSIYAYAVNDLNTYYRLRTLDGESENSRIVRTGLNNIAFDPVVQNAVRQTGARYLLVLDQGASYEQGEWLPTYRHPDEWRAIDAIRDTTPGFKVILKRDDMRLYEITCL